MKKQSHLYISNSGAVSAMRHLLIVNGQRENVMQLIQQSPVHLNADQQSRSINNVAVNEAVLLFELYELFRF